MKRLATLIILLTLTSTSFCQTGTRTQQQSSDSLIVLPTRLVKFLIQDLIKGDNARKIVVQQDSLLSEKNKQLSLKDSVMLVYQQQDTIFRATTEEFSKIEAVHARNIQSLQLKSDKYKRQRNVFAGFAAALLIGLIVK